MSIAIDYAKGFVHKGNTAKVKDVLNKAAKGEPVTIAFLGGSITQGCLATTHELCYAKRTYDWFVKKYPTAEITYVNAGIGGTSSQYGVSRVDGDVLSKHPDLVFVEFSVNDEPAPEELGSFFKETYEGLVRHILSAECQPAVFLIHNIFYDDGRSAEDYHREVGAHYGLPSVSMRPTVYALVKEGVITSKDVTEDDLHPNDQGHELLAGVICHALEEIDGQPQMEPLAGKLPAPITPNTYEYSSRFQNADILPELKGFVKDSREKEGYLDIFSRGWIAKNTGDTITFKVKGSGLALQYKKTPKKPAPVAQAVIDGDEAHPILVDANFDEDWGDSLHMATLLSHGENKEHTIELKIVKTTPEDQSAFYLVSVIAN
ncbi:MAG: SGNH/GDSL hydrolase family protein [Lachnospiraceae bacterium]|nr:SGNH/GDSL hydrolase family protein [Lachnospiraceae bacterium]